MDEPSIEIREDGPYLVSGGVPLARKRILRSEQGESVTWATDEVEQQDGRYALCRCGLSSEKPYCDGTHKREGFDGTESAPTDTYAERAKDYDGTGMVLHDDRGTCAHAAFCATKETNTWKMLARTDDTAVRSQAMAMAERCPSGALTYSVEGEVVEPDLPTRIGVVEDGPLWIMGGIAVERADGEVFEARNRVVLCRCGESANKPLCDGSHVDAGFTG